MIILNPHKYLTIPFLINLWIANLKKTLSQFTEANGDKDLITAAMDKLQPLITAANIGK